MTSGGSGGTTITRGPATNTFERYVTSLEEPYCLFGEKYGWFAEEGRATNAGLEKST